MKTFKKLASHALVLCMVFSMVGICIASVGVKSSGTDIGQATDIDFSTGITATMNGSAVTIVSNSNSTTANITTGTINNATIGATTGTTGNFTTVKGTAFTGTTYTATGNVTTSAGNYIATNGNVYLPTASTGIYMTAGNGTIFKWTAYNNGTLNSTQQ